MRHKVKFIQSVLAMSVLLVLLVTLTACSGKDFKFESLSADFGSRPTYSSLIDEEGKQLVQFAMSESASEAVKKQAALYLYNVANRSRIDTESSLLIQNTSMYILQLGADIPDDKKRFDDDEFMIGVPMHGFNLRSEDEWYYQLVAHVDTDSEILQSIFGRFMDMAKVAYRVGGSENFIKLGGKQIQADCSMADFPYASFRLTQQPEEMSHEQLLERAHCVESMHEINNMRWSAQIIADGVSIEYANGYYTVKFEVDVNADEQSLKDWYALPEMDMADSDQHINRYLNYRAELQVWDNGYARYWRAQYDRDAGSGSGRTVDEFYYLWDEEEISRVCESDANFKALDTKEKLHFEKLTDYIRYYADRDVLPTRFPTLYIVLIVLAAVLVIGIVASVVTVEVLLKKGKLPKLAAKRKARKDAKEAKRAAEANRKDDATDASENAEIELSDSEEER